MTMIAEIGQSNMGGYLNDGPAPYTPNNFVYIWDAQTHGWEAMVPGVNTGIKASPHSWGPEVQIANEWLEHWLPNHPGDVLAIVKSWDGGIGLAQDSTQQDFSPESRGEMYDKTIAMIKAAGDAIGGQRPVVTMIMQGETDGFDFSKSQAYMKNEQDFVQHYRQDAGTENVVIGRIADTSPYWEQVRFDQYVMGRDDPNHIHTFDTYDFARRVDNLHYTAESQIELGHRFFEGWMTFS